MSLFLIHHYISTVSVWLKDTAIYYYSLPLIGIEKPTDPLGLERKTGWASLIYSMVLMLASSP